MRQILVSALLTMACSGCMASRWPSIVSQPAPPVQESDSWAGPQQERDVIEPKPVATDDQMLHKYVWSTIGFDGALSATLTSGWAQFQGSPPEWNKSATGYSRRWASEYAESAIGDGAKYAVAHFFHQDPSFYPCACTGFGNRLHHAVESPFMARKRDGTRVPSAASLAGILTGHVVSASTWYPAPRGTRDGLMHAGMSLASKMAVDVFKEFRPRRSPKRQ